MSSGLPASTADNRVDVYSSPISRLMSTSPTMAQEIPAVAVVDDDASVRAGLGNLIRAIGWRSELFDGGAAFIGQDVSRFACVLSDMQMPGMSGLELQRELAACAPTLPVIFITGYPDESIRQAALAAGARGFFEKPFDVEELVATLERVVGGA